jgi:hypothetical protein
MKFLSPAEARAACLRLDETATMRVSEYASLVAENAFPENDQVICQLINEKGQACRQRHGKGFVAKRNDGVELFIGGDCAHKHFGAESGFATDAEMLQRANRVRDLRDRIAARKAEPVFAETLRADWSRSEELKKRIAEERAALPSRVVGRLVDMMKTGGRSVPGEVRDVEIYKDEHGNEHERITWRAVTLATVASPEGLNLEEIESVQATLRAARKALREDVPTSSLERQLKEIVVALDAAPACSMRVAALEQSFKSFLTAANLQAASWLALRAEDQETVVARALELARRSSRSQQIRASIAEWTRELQAANGGRAFRPLA